MATMSVSGIISGMDWESMIDEIITNAAAPAQPQVNKKTNLTNKKSLFEEMKTTMNSLQSSLSPLKLPSTYKAKTIDIERLDKNSSYKGVLTATVNADAEVNVWDVTVKQLASAQINRSKQITGSSLSSTLNGVSGNTMYINAGGQKIGIEVKSSDTLESLKSRINTTLKTLESPIYVTASVVDNKLILKSDYTGLGTMTANETTRYNYSSGINRLNNISIPEAAYDNVKVTSGSKSYVIHKDFEVANGNEIRWKQYDRGDKEHLEVGLSGKATVNYKMAAGDQYKTTGTYNDKEAEISGFDLVDNGTLASRAKIVDADGNTYEYGKDFTIKDKKIVWLEDTTPTTNEPDSYTVSYSKTVEKSYSAECVKTNPTSVPASYTVQYTKDIIPSTSLTYGRHDSGYSYVKITAGSLTTFSGLTALDGVSSVTSTSSPYNTYLKFDNDSEPLININGTDYVYGRDYIVRKGASTDEMFLVPYTAYNTDINDYLTSAGKTIPDGIQISPKNDIEAGSTGTISYSHTTSIDSSDQTAIANLLNDSNTDMSRVVILKSDGTEYTEGVDYHISDGEIVWTLPNDFTDITNEQFAEIQTKYAEATDSELKTVTLVDRNGYLRTYVDPDDPSLFKMSAGGVDYEYGRDYVLRVNDAGTGYRFDWLIDGSNTITDANTTVATYAAKKNISTSSWQAAPSEGTDFTFGFNYSVTTSASGNVNKTSTDKSLATVLEDVTVDSSDYSTALTITDSSGNTYAYGTDWTIDSGNITWLDLTPRKPADDATFTVTYGSTSSSSLNTTDNADYSVLELTGTSSLPDDIADNLTITDSGGNTYTYGRDFTVNNDGTINWLADGPQYPTGEYTFYYDAFSVSTDGTDTYTTGTTSQEVSIKISDEAGNIGEDKDTVSYEQILKFAGVSSTTDQTKIDSALGSLFSLTDNSGNTYTYGTDYKVVKGSLDSDSGEYTTAIEWIESTEEKPTRKPDNGAALTLTFTGGETISTTLQRSATDSAFSPSVTLDDLDGGTVTITQGMKTFYKGVDFKLAEDDDGNAAIEWISDDDGGYEWFYPEAGTSYTVNFTDENGNTTTYRGYKNSSDTLDMADLGMTTANGSISFQYGDGLSYKLDAPSQYDSDGNEVADTDGHAAIKSAYSTDITKNGTAFNFRWLTPPLTSHSNLPSMNEEITVEYDYDANTFDLEDDSNGDLLYALGFVKSDKTTYDDYTAAKNAILDVDGEEVERDSNDIGADYENELLKGVTLHLKGLGEVSLDISHDAEKAVTSIQTFVDNYNDLMSWMNTRMTEKQLDEDTKATVDSDDFRMRWGLLHGNSLLRNTKSQMRSLTSQNFTFSFTQRKSSEEIYGPMSFNGLKTTSTLRLRIGTKYVDVTIDPTDTLETIVKKISDDTKGGAMNDIYYDDNGEKLQTPLLKALVENDKLVIQSTSNDEITMSGSAAMNALKMNYTYKGLYQIGIESTSDDYGKSGELVFDESEFMEALEDDPDEVQALMLKFVGNFDTWIKSMLNSSASGETSGTLTREIENIQSRIDSINEYLENYQDRLDRMEESLRTRYANTETQFSKLSQQANSIAAILNQLNGTASGGGYGQTSS